MKRIALVGLGLGSSLGIGACNLILDNQPWTLAQDAGEDATADHHTPPALDAGDASTALDGNSADATTDSPPDSPADAPQEASLCPDGGSSCGASCFDLTSDPRNCGGCGHNCSQLPNVSGAGATCVASKCVIPASACTAGFAHCSALPDDGCETDITKAAHCGSCSNVCGVAAPLCTGSGTTYTCTTGCAAPKPTLCGTSCVDLTSDPKNCNTCNNQCPAPGGGTATCVSSTCDFACNTNFHKCGATCADNFSTGSCGASCSACVPPANAGATCNGTTCGFNCNTNFTNCSNVCVDERSDPSNCGACAHVCGSVNGTGSCAGSACSFACSAGYKHCGANDATGCATHTDIDPNNCGSCGNVCPLAEQCAGGSCQCDPTKTPSQDPCVVNDTLGVFVAPTGSDAAAGSKALPFATIGKGLTAAKASGKRVYVCAGTFDEKLVINAALDGVRVYGGLACPGAASAWSYSGAKAIVAPTTTGYPLKLDSLSTGVVFEDMQFNARAGVSAGESSIAVFANASANVVLRRVTAQAGNGVAGAAGFTNSNGQGTATRGADASGDVGANATNCTCANGTGSTAGGGGGDGPVGSGGQAGIPNLGAGAGGSGSGPSGSTCTGGQTGGVGPTGSVGTGATVYGSASAGGWAPAPGAGGGGGGVGQGGGGGGAVQTSAGGGGGGCGGCGGVAGGGAQGGGSSFAVFSVASPVTLDACSLVAANAGGGGQGGAGQVAQMGGGPGGGACNGGSGGVGGVGGGGGGGAGGLSVAVAYKGTQPNSVNGTTMQVGAAGGGGGGGAAGIAGTATNTLAVP